MKFVVDRTKSSRWCLWCSVFTEEISFRRSDQIFPTTNRIFFRFEISNRSFQFRRFDQHRWLSQWTDSSRILMQWNRLVQLDKISFIFAKYSKKLWKWTFNNSVEQSIDFSRNSSFTWKSSESNWYFGLLSIEFSFICHDE